MASLMNPATSWHVFRLRPQATLGMSSTLAGAKRLMAAVCYEADFRPLGDSAWVCVDGGTPVAVIARRDDLTSALEAVAQLEQPAAPADTKPAQPSGELRVRLPASLLPEIEQLRGDGPVKPSLNAVAVAAVVAGLRHLIAQQKERTTNHE